MKTLGAAALPKEGRRARSAAFLVGKRVLVVGMARSGLASAAMLRELGASVLACDGKSAAELGEALGALRRLGCDCLTGDAFPRSAQGVDLILVSPGIPPDLPLLLDARNRGIPVTGELELASRIAEGDFVAVTGTNGKTTTVSLLGEVFRRFGKKTHVAGNIGLPLSAVALKSEPADCLVIEVSSFQLETVESFHPRIAALLNVTHDHMDRHGSFQNYLRLKTRIFENQSHSDFAVLNHDDETCLKIAKGLKASPVWFSRRKLLSAGAFVKADIILWRWQSEEWPVCPVSALKIPGSHNLENALAATAVACAAGLPAQHVGEALKAFEGIEHRMEFVRERRGVRYINDSKGTNPASTVKAVEAMRSPTVLIAGGYDKHVSFVSLARSVVSSGRVSHVILIGQTAKQIAQALKEQGFLHSSRAESLEEAVHIAASGTDAGSSVLFSPACASFDMFTDYEERGRRFKDIVCALDPGEEI